MLNLDVLTRNDGSATFRLKVRSSWRRGGSSTALGTKTASDASLNPKP